MAGGFFTDETNGWGAGKFGRIVSTGDGGNTWEIEDSEVGCDLLGLDAVRDGNRIRVWVVGALGMILACEVRLG
jgi:photosystem II stability/assembly factor-like uncharacterized protein